MMSAIGEQWKDRYPLLIHVKPHPRPVRARRDGRYFVTPCEINLSLWHTPRNVEVLQDE